MANPFVHVELSSTDVGAARNFYGKLFDWKLEDVPMGPDMTYTMINVGEGTGGGMMKNMIPGSPSFWPMCRWTTSRRPRARPNRWGPR
jgi:hypothetical protein